MRTRSWQKVRTASLWASRACARASCNSMRIPRLLRAGGMPSRRTTPPTCPAHSVGYELPEALMRAGSGAAPGYSSWPLRNGYTGVTSNQVPHSSETMMRFYNQQHRFYCGVDLHARTLSLHILDAAGKTVLAKTIAATPDAFLAAVAPFRDGLAVAAECM